MTELPPPPQTAVFHIDHKRRKVTPERAKANYLVGQLRLRLQYAKLKVEHGWQRQTLNEVENLYFRHTHKNRPPATPNLGGRRTSGSNGARYTPNMLFPVNEYRPEHNAATEHEVLHKGEVAHFQLVPAIADGVVATEMDEVPPSTEPAETSAAPAISVRRPHSGQSGPDSGTLEQAAASMFSPPPPVTAAHTSSQLNIEGPVPPSSIPMTDATLVPHSNGMMPAHLQHANVPFSMSEPSFYHPGQQGHDPFYAAQTQAFQYEFHYHTPQPPPAPPPSQLQQDFAQSLPPPSHTQLQTPPQHHPSPQSRHTQPDTFRPIAPAAPPSHAPAPANQTLTYDAFWSSHSLSAPSYRNVLFNSPESTAQGMGGHDVHARPGALSLAHGGVPVFAPMPAAGLSDMSAAHAPAQNA